MDDLMRERFKEIVYDLLSEDDSNFRANMIIDAADEYAESMKPQWISFTAETAPKESGLYFVKCKTETGRKEISADRYSSDYCEWFIHDNDTVIAWTPAPKEEGEQNGQN